jgi:hypothetical protein
MAARAQLSKLPVIGLVMNGAGFHIGQRWQKARS